MNLTVFTAIIDKLQADTTLTGYLGGPHILRAYSSAPAQIPSVTVMVNNGGSKHRPGAATTKRRDANPTVQIDVWVSSASEDFPSTGEDADEIANCIDSILMDASSPVTNTTGWERTTESQQHEGSENIWHNALRYSFRYSMTD
jgi:hypothetical protein